MVEDAAGNYHLAKFGNNCKTRCGNMDRNVKKTLTGGEKLASSLSMGLDGELIVQSNYWRTLYT